MNCGTPLRAGERESAKTTNANTSELSDPQLLGQYLPPELVAKLEVARLRLDFDEMLAIAEDALQELQVTFPACTPKGREKIHRNRTKSTECSKGQR